MSTKPPPSGPTEQEVREHFGDKLKADAKLMRPAYTSIWALEDGTLLWDWRGGFAVIGSADHSKSTTPSNLKAVIYLTGRQGSGKSTLVTYMRNAVELQRLDYKSIRSLMCAIDYRTEHETIVVTEQVEIPGAADGLKAGCKQRGLIFKHLKL